MSKFTKEKRNEIAERLEQLITDGYTISEICKELNISRASVHRWCKKLNMHIPNRHNALKFDNTVFDIIDTEEKAYWLGFLYADGSVSTNVNIVSVTLKYSDISHLEKLNCFLHNKAAIGIHYIKNGEKEYKSCRTQVCDKHFKMRLIELGCVPNKSLVLRFPDLSVFANPNLVYPFIRGYVDGDGCLTFSKNGRLELSIAGTKEFLSGVMSIFKDKFGTLHRIQRAKNEIYKISNCGKKADEVTYQLYNNAKIYLDRKYDRFAVLNRKVQNYYGAKTVKAETLIPC